MLDTPGLFDTSHLHNEHVVKEISRAISMTSPGPHIFFYVVRVGRFTQEDNESANLFFKHFGDAASRFTILLFTFADALDDTIEEYLKTATPELKNLLTKCKHRYCTVDNKSTSASKRNDHVSNIIQMVDLVISKNEGEYYSNEMFNAHADLMRKQESEFNCKAIENERKRLKKVKDKRTEELQRQLEIGKRRQQELQQAVDVDAERLRGLREEEESQRRITEGNRIRVEKLREEVKEQQQTNEDRLRAAQEENRRRAEAEKTRLMEQLEAESPGGVARRAVRDLGKVRLHVAVNMYFRKTMHKICRFLLHFV